MKQCLGMRGHGKCIRGGTNITIKNNPLIPMHELFMSRFTIIALLLSSVF